MSLLQNVDPLPLYLFAASLLFFHASEFAFAFRFQRKTLSARSLLFSFPYVLAMLSAVAEYFAEAVIFAGVVVDGGGGATAQRSPPPTPSSSPLRRRDLLYNSTSLDSLRRSVTLFGVIVVVCGELLRKTAMLTAARAFTHDLARTKKKEHELVTRGVYALMRHPAYVGFLLYAVGTQLILRNLFCFVAFAVVVARFLKARVEAEEALLVSFFGAEYARYASRVRRWGLF